MTSFTREDGDEDDDDLPVALNDTTGMSSSSMLVSEGTERGQGSAQTDGESRQESSALIPDENTNTVGVLQPAAAAAKVQGSSLNRASCHYPVAETRTGGSAEDEASNLVVALHIGDETLNDTTLESVNLSHLQTVGVDMADVHVLDVLQDVDIDPERPDYGMGDHVYQWCSFAGIPSVYQHHGIVMDVLFRGGEWVLQIADFSNWMPDENDNLLGKSGSGNMPKQLKSLRSNCESTGGCIRTYNTTADDATWHKVEYQVGFWKQNMWRSGTCTAASCDSPGMVRARVQFLQEHSELLPPYSVVQSNCECVAVWCKTGTWGTLQATSWLSVTAAGQAKSAATLAGVATTTQVTAPAAGLWGWLGYTTHASLAATQPYLLPAILAYGVVTVGTPALWLLHAKKKWKNLTIKLNESFWESAVDHPDIFVDNITHWSSQHDPAESVRAKR